LRYTQLNNLLRAARAGTDRDGLIRDGFCGYSSSIDHFYVENIGFTLTPSTRENLLTLGAAHGVVYTPTQLMSRMLVPVMFTGRTLAPYNGVNLWHIEGCNVDLRLPYKPTHSA
jgi:hypothetical protein